MTARSDATTLDELTRHRPAEGGDEPAAPREGDLVVAEDTARPGHFTIRQVPGQPQVSLSSAMVALTVAETLARSHAIDVWLVTDTATRTQRFRLRDPLRDGARPARYVAPQPRRVTCG